ncbi:Uncharacterized protein FWK35_00035009, partial [Aphis craccivora]
VIIDMSKSLMGALTRAICNGLKWKCFQSSGKTRLKEFYLLEGQSYEKENNFTSYSDVSAAPEIEDVYEEEIELNTSNSIITFLNNINHISLSAASVMQHSVTTKINAYFLVDFGKNMIKLCSTFPIWSNNRILKNESKPMKVDKSDIYFI